MKHDVNYHHEHELLKLDFLGCCQDCRRSLEIIKPHIMAFAEIIKQYDTKALTVLDHDDLYRLFLHLDDLAHMNAGEHLSALILDEPDIAPPFRSFVTTTISFSAFMKSTWLRSYSSQTAHGKRLNLFRSIPAMKRW